MHSSEEADGRRMEEVAQVGGGTAEMADLNGMDSFLGTKAAIVRNMYTCSVSSILYRYSRYIL